MDKKEIIEQFLDKLGMATGRFYIVCGKCGAKDELDKDGGNIIEQEITGIYSEYTGHLWDTVNIKCLLCGNATNFEK